MNLSLRTRIVMGAILWTLGLFISLLVVSTAILLRYPRYPLVLHGAAHHYALACSVVAFLCLVFGMAQVRRGLSSIEQIRDRLGAVHRGAERSVGGRYPTEVQPLVDDLNALLAHREQAVARALAKAGDLAHGLKTPLAILGQETARAEADGQGELAATIGQQVARMHRQVEYHLAQARAAASGATPGARCQVSESADALTRTLLRLHAGRGLTIDSAVAPEHVVRAQREDLDEMLGNLLDNACKWARAHVAIASASAGGRVVITIDDDGPGIPASMRDKAMLRGVRVDEAAPGSGLGLSIARELAELYGGSVALDQSGTGGLRARLDLPAA